MGEIIGLGQERKKIRNAKQRLQADVNATKFGRTKQQKTREIEEIARLKTHLDQIKIDRDD